MKITAEHYKRIRDELALRKDAIIARSELIDNDPRVKDISMRVRWDALYMAGLMQFICSEVYPYANDTHVDTALRKVMVDIGLPQFSTSLTKDPA